MRYHLMLSALLSLVLGGCAPARVDESAITDGLAQAIAAGVGAEVRLGELARSDWRTVAIFGPYTRPAAIRRCLGAGAQRVATRGIESRDDVVLLVFGFPDGTYESTAIGRHAAEFGPEALDRQYEKARSHFVVRTPPTGSRGRLAPVSDLARRCT